jgi:hypothetical protein
MNRTYLLRSRRTPVGYPGIRCSHAQVAMWAIGGLSLCASVVVMCFLSYDTFHAELPWFLIVSKLRLRYVAYSGLDGRSWSKSLTDRGARLKHLRDRSSRSFEDHRERMMGGDPGPSSGVHGHATGAALLRVRFWCKGNDRDCEICCCTAGMFTGIRRLVCLLQ